MSGIFESENGLGAGIFREVMKRVEEAGAATPPNNADAVAFDPPGAGAVARPVGVKLREIAVVAADYVGGPTNRTTTAAVPMAATAAPFPTEFQVTAWDNKYGADVTPHGVAHNRTSGRVYNPADCLTARSFGQETLQHWFNKFANASNKNSGDTVGRLGLIAGDSTTDGTGAGYGTPQYLLTDLAQARGYSNVTILNRGHGGKTTFDWLASFLDEDIAAAPDLMVLRYGANDAFFGKTVEQTLDALRTGLTRLRAWRGVDQLSIVLMTPTTMNDVENGRTGVRSEQLNAGYRQAALDFQCAFIDTYAHFSNSWDGAGVWMDKDTSLYAPGRAIHPHDVMYEHICGVLADMIYPNWGANWRANVVRNVGGLNPASVRTGVEPTSSYFAGVGMHRIAAGAGTDDGAPFDGVVYTFKQADGATLQFCVPLMGVTGGGGLTARIGFNGVWSDWYGQRRDGTALLVGGWNNDATFAPLTYRLSMENELSLSGLIRIGASTADGTTIFVLPPGYRPPRAHLMLIGTETGMCRLQVLPTGEAKIYGFGAGGGYVMLSGVSFSV